MLDQTLLTYGAIVHGFVFITGPATLLTVGRSATSGQKAGIATGAGVTVGEVDIIRMARFRPRYPSGLSPMGNPRTVRAGGNVQSLLITRPPRCYDAHLG
jgi:hypothetical protein